MRIYGAIQTRFWAHEDVRKLSDQSKLLAIYLLSSSHTNMLGCFRIPVGYIAEDLKWSSEQVKQGLSDLSHINFLVLDEHTDWLFIQNFLKYHPIDNPNQGKSIVNIFEETPKDLIFIIDLVNKLLEQNKHLPDTFCNCLETLLEEFSNQEQEQNKDQEQKTKSSLWEEVVRGVDKSVIAKVQPTCPHQEIINLYHQTLPMCSPVRVWNKTRQKHLRQRWSENSKHQTLDWWKNYFEYVKQSEFLIGKVTGRNGSPPFVVNLEWLVRPNNFV